MSAANQPAQGRQVPVFRLAEETLTRLRVHGPLTDPPDDAVVGVALHDRRSWGRGCTEVTAYLNPQMTRELIQMLKGLLHAAGPAAAVEPEGAHFVVTAEGSYWFRKSNGLYNTIPSPRPDGSEHEGHLTFVELLSDGPVQVFATSLLAIISG